MVSRAETVLLYVALDLSAAPYSLLLGRLGSKAFFSGCTLPPLDFV